MTKILLDTDIGTDFDDAVALAYLLRHPKCELVGITTVCGEAEKRAMLASALCRAAGKGDIPIYPGSERTLLGNTSISKVARQAAALARMDHQTEFPRHQHIRFMADTIRAHPGEIVLLAIGPLTNIGILFAAEPDIPALLRGLVLMGGDFGSGSSEREGEWNIRGDAHAASIVYRAECPIHRSVGVDITKQVSLTDKEAKRAFRGDLFEAMMILGDVWFANRDYIYFHDPLAAAIALGESGCTLNRGDVTVELQPGAQYGVTRLSQGAKGRHEVAVSVDRQEFLKNYFRIFTESIGEE